MLLRALDTATPAIERVLRVPGRRADCDRGRLRPGPFGVVTATTMSHALNNPSSGVCSLDVIAADAEPGGEFVVATDARRRQSNWAGAGNH